MTELSPIKLYATQEHPCSYLDDQLATTAFVDPHAVIDTRLYSELSDHGFRRSGKHLYRPHCQNCQACIPIRLAVADFKANKSQRRCLKLNRDLDIQVVDSIATDEHYQLYDRYICQRHADGDMYPPSWEQYQDFLCPSWGVTQYLEFREQGRLLAIAVSDVLDQGLSAIYTFFEPEEQARSLGKFAVLAQIERAKTAGVPYLYLGYWIKNCAKMEYKNQYRPLQMFINNRWMTFV